MNRKQYVDGWIDAIFVFFFNFPSFFIVDFSSSFLPRETIELGDKKSCVCMIVYYYNPTYGVITSTP